MTIIGKIMIVHITTAFGKDKNPFQGFRVYILLWLKYVGCGYGVIGLSLKKAYPDKQVTMLDINPRAVELTKLNAQNNQCEVAVHVSDAYDKVMDQRFTDIITNPPQEKFLSLSI